MRVWVILGRGSRRLPAGLVGMLGLLLVVETLVAGGAPGLATFRGLCARFAGEAAEQEAVGARVLVLGDSVMKFGFDPEAFDREAGRSGVGGAFNLAVPGTPPLLGEALLRRALAAGARPEAVLVGYMTLSGDPKVHLNDFAEVFTPADAYRLAREADDPSFFLGVMAPRVLPSLRYRGALRAGLIAAILGRRGEPGAPIAPEVPGPKAAAEHWGLWVANRGAEFPPADGRFDGRMEPELERRLYSHRWFVHPMLARSFRRICDLASAHGAEVYVVVPPITPEAQARRDTLGLDAPHTQNLQAVVSRTSGATVLDARRAGFAAEFFFDSCHLNVRGAARLSAELAAAIDLNREATSERPVAWINLPVAARVASETLPDQTR